MDPALILEEHRITTKCRNTPAFAVGHHSVRSQELYYDQLSLVSYSHYFQMQRG